AMSTDQGDATKKASVCHRSFSCWMKTLGFRGAKPWEARSCLKGNEHRSRRCNKESERLSPIIFMLDENAWLSRREVLRGAELPQGQ
ncbi:hypothetical protein, partial [Aureibacillus halotolerans]|uniref:hypothetical protein n=1 Tax=Aureibacillus halotolerans TaxID=1508390 RepID=UPI001AAD5828